MAEREESRRRHRQDDEEKGLLADEVMISLLKIFFWALDVLCRIVSPRTPVGRDNSFNVIASAPHLGTAKWKLRGGTESFNFAGYEASRKDGEAERKAEEARR